MPKGQDQVYNLKDGSLQSSLADQFEAAVVALAGHGALKDRLSAAYCDHIEGIDEQELPLELQQDFSELTKAVHAARALPGDSVVRASVRKFSNDEAQRAAALIVRAYGLCVQAQSATAKVSLRFGSLTRNGTPLAALLALEGGNTSGPRPQHATGP